MSDDIDDKALDVELGILHETEHLWLNRKLEICLHANTHSVVVGKAKTIEQAKRCMGRLEPYIDNLKKMYRVI